MTPEVAFIAGMLVAAAIILSRWAAEERRRAAELETIVQLIQRLTTLQNTGETTDGNGTSENHLRARVLDL